MLVLTGMLILSGRLDQLANFAHYSSSSARFTSGSQKLDLMINAGGDRLEHMSSIPIP